MRQIKKRLTSQSSEAYIYLCVIIVFVSMLLSVFILYMSLTAQVQIQKKGIQAKLDDFVAEYAVREYDALRQGSAKDDLFHWDDMEADLYPALGFPEKTDPKYLYENGGCRITRPNVTILKEIGFGVRIEYTAVFPVTWNGIAFPDLEIPVTVTSRYKMK